MKILFATMQYGHGYAQGTERYLSILAGGLRSRGHEAVFLAGDPEHRAPAAPLGREVQRAPRVLAYPSRGWMSIGGLPAGSLRALLNDVRPDVVHVANPAHIGVGLLGAAHDLGLPTVVTIMDYWWICPKQTLWHRSGEICDAKVPWTECFRCIAADRSGSLRARLARLPIVGDLLLPPMFAGRWLARGVPLREIGRWTRRQAYILSRLAHVDVVITPSKTAAGLIRDRAPGPTFAAIPYGLERHWLEDDSDVRPQRTPDGSLTVGFAGALAPHKGPHVLLEALQQLPGDRFRLRLAGGGDDETYLHRLRRLAEGRHVEFLGRVAPEHMPAFVRALDVLVVPSLWPENLPFVVLEGHACGVPVVASDVGGIAETVADPDRLFPPGDAMRLAERLERLASTGGSRPLPPVSPADEMVEATVAAYSAARRPATAAPAAVIR